MSSMATQNNCRSDIRTLKTAILLIWMGLFIAFGNAENPASDEDLKHINEHAIKSIEVFSLMAMPKTEYGETLDCVDIYTQPAFNHPLLKNHTIQMRPTSFPEGTEDDSEGSLNDLEITLTDCPEGTVPIPRQDLFSKPPNYMFGKKYNRNGTYMEGKYDLTTFHRYAAVGLPQGEYFGTRARMNVWPMHLASNKMFSLGQFWLAGGPDDHVNTVEAGWMVNPIALGDQPTRLFVFWTGDNYNDGCFNTQCPGYVQVSHKRPMGLAIKPLSTYNGPQKDITLMAFKDPKTSNWWLTMGRNNQELLGYWPKELFPYLGKGPANHVYWGGEVFNPTDLPYPPMGSGHFPGEGFGKASYMSMLQVVNGNNVLLDIPNNAKIFEGKPQCYNVDSSTRKDGKEWGRYFYYGGPGGKC